MIKRIKQGFSLLPIRTRITIVTSTIIILAIFSGSALLIANVYEALEQEQGYRVLAIARTVAQLENIKEGLNTPDGWLHIQPVAERIRLATDVEYVVVFDMERIRYSHPLESKIGTYFEGGDEGPSLGQNEYISLAKGSQGAAIRAFVPILDSEGFEQIGVVVVGKVLPNIYQLIYEHSYDFYISIALGVAVGLFGAWLLTNSIKKQMHDLEPIEIAQLLEERESLINSIEEGIIAIDRNKKIRVMNQHAARILGVAKDITGHSIEEVIPQSKLPEVIQTGLPQSNQVMILNKTIVLTNRLPIKVKGHTVGAVATFQDRTEVIHLAEELTGIRKIIDAVRAQNHEYMNRLHTIAGLIQLERYDDALDIIYSYTDVQEELTLFLKRNIKNYGIIGLILGKISHAKEHGVQLIVERDSKVPSLPKYINTQDLIVIIGNLLENAISATLTKEQEDKRVWLRLETIEDKLLINVKDNGIGIPVELQEDIFTLGFTTKGAKGQGIGLALIKQYVEAVNGTIAVKSDEQKGTAFYITIPYNQRENDRK